MRSRLAILACVRLVPFSGAVRGGAIGRLLTTGDGAFKQLASLLAPVDCKTLDHFVVAGEKTTSFAERGLL
jgi:hypothetical protein